MANEAWEKYTDANGRPEVVGSDGGVIVTDEEYDGGARMTLERLGDVPPFPCGITCGIYGWMVHTRRFPTLAEAQVAYDEMKPGLAAILDMIPMRADPEVDIKTERAIDAMSKYVDAFP
jgi:hypothetical protein